MDGERAVKALQDAALYEEAAWAATWIPSKGDWKVFIGEAGERSIMNRRDGESDDDYFRRIGFLFFTRRRLEDGETENDRDAGGEMHAIEMHYQLGSGRFRDRSHDDERTEDDDEPGAVAIIEIPKEYRLTKPEFVEFHGAEGYSPMLVHPDAVNLAKPHPERPDQTIIRLSGDDQPFAVVGSYAETKRKLGFNDDGDEA